MYVAGNPLRYVDPSGHRLEEGAGNVAGGEYRRRRGGGGGGFGGLPEKVKNRTPIWYYWNSQQSGMELFNDWRYERGSKLRIYGPNAAMTRDLKNDEGVQAARELFYKDTSRNIQFNYRFSHPSQPVREELQYRVSQGLWFVNIDNSGVGRVLGGYKVLVEATKNNQGERSARFTVLNVMGRESFARLLGRGPSVEGYFNGERPKNKGFKNTWPKSVFENKWVCPK